MCFWRSRHSVAMIPGAWAVYLEIRVDYVMCKHVLVHNHCKFVHVTAQADVLICASSDLWYIKISVSFKLEVHCERICQD